MAGAGDGSPDDQRKRFAAPRWFARPLVWLTLGAALCFAVSVYCYLDNRHVARDGVTVRGEIVSVGHSQFDRSDVVTVMFVTPDGALKYVRSMNIKLPHRPGRRLWVRYLPSDPGDTAYEPGSGGPDPTGPFVFLTCGLTAAAVLTWRRPLWTLRLGQWADDQTLRVRAFGRRIYERVTPERGKRSVAAVGRGVDHMIGADEARHRHHRGRRRNRDRAGQSSDC